MNVTKIYAQLVAFNVIPHSLCTGLTDEEVDLAIQRSGSTEEPLTVAVPGPAHIAHPVQLAPYSM